MVYGLNNNNNVNFTGNFNYGAKDIENLARYATGVAITNKSDLSMQEVITYPIMPSLISGGSWLWNNKKDLKGAFGTLKAEQSAVNQLYKTAGFQGVVTASAGNALLKSIPTAEALGKVANMTTSTKDLFTAARKAAETAAKLGTKDAINQAHNLFAKANQAAYLEKVAGATGIGSKIQNVLGITKLNKGINALAVKSPGFAKGLHAFKANGGGMMLALEGGLEVLTNVVPTFKQLGTKAGMKQIGKSAVKTAASVGGWVAGAALGTKIGAAIGSIIPGAGTAVGAVVGGAIGSICSLLCGSLASRLAKKGAEKIVGKDELVLAQEKQAKQLAQAAQQDTSVLNQVIGGASERLEAEGTETDDAKVAFKSLSTVVDKAGSNSQTASNPFLSATARSVSEMRTDKDLMAQSVGMAY